MIALELAILILAVTVASAVMLALLVNGHIKKAEKVLEWVHIPILILMLIYLVALAIS